MASEDIRANTIGTGCKIAVVDDTGKLLFHTVMYLVQGDQATERARSTLMELCERYKPVAVAVGNGTHGRETEAFVRDVLAQMGLKQTWVVSVNEAGASVFRRRRLLVRSFRTWM